MYSCGHECCKHGIPIKWTVPAKPTHKATTKTAPTKPCEPLQSNKFPGNQMSRYVDQLHAKANNLPQTPTLKRIKVLVNDNTVQP